MRDPYPCQGRMFTDQREATEALEEHRRHGFRSRLIEVESPYTYLCVHGHWHYSLVQRAL